MLRTPKVVVVCGVGIGAREGMTNARPSFATKKNTSRRSMSRGRFIVVIAKWRKGKDGGWVWWWYGLVWYGMVVYHHSRDADEIRNERMRVLLWSHIREEALIATAHLLKTHGGIVGT